MGGSKNLVFMNDPVSAPFTCFMVISQPGKSCTN